MRTLTELADYAHSLGKKGQDLSKADGVTFEEWCALVDQLIVDKCGLGRDDIDDWTYAVDYDGEVSVGETRDYALENAGWESEE